MAEVERAPAERLATPDHGLSGQGLGRRRPAEPVPVVPLAGVDPVGSDPVPTGVPEVDRVLNGGLLPGSMTLVFGEPGVGKSTLLLQVLVTAAARCGPVLLVSAEESAAQVRARATRLGVLPEGLLIVATSSLDDALDAVVDLQPSLVVVDSIQTLVDRSLPGAPGSLAQVRACLDQLDEAAKVSGAAIVLVGHVTKDGDLAGPRSLEHLVDTVVSFEGDRHHSLRLLRAVKHRFGPTGEVGLFEMGEAGLEPVADAGPLLLGDRRSEVPGSAVTVALQGRRPLVVEVQALACSGGGNARRSAQGLDAPRLGMLLAVLECRAGVQVGGLEIYASAAGGIRVTEPAADLAVTLALASAVAGVALPPGLVAFGEIGLAGEVRSVPGIEQRLREAARLGFTHALVPEGADRPTRTDQAVPAFEQMTVRGVRTVADALVTARNLEAQPVVAGAGGPGTGDLPTGTIPSWSTAAARL